MKKIFFIPVVMCAFIMTACAQNDVAMADNSDAINEINAIEKAYSTDNFSVDELKELKNMLIEELKKTDDWDYEDSQYYKINILSNSINDDKSSALIFIWTYRSKSKSKSGYDYILTNQFKKSYNTNRVWAVDEVDPMRFVKR